MYATSKGNETQTWVKSHKTFNLISLFAGERSERWPPVAGDELLRRSLLPGRGDVRGQDCSEYNVVKWVKTDERSQTVAVFAGRAEGREESVIRVF